MEGFILCAGMGSRLRPLTDHTPKALMTVGGVPLIDIAINTLCQAGIHHIVVNIHHLGEQIVEHLSTRRWDARIDISDERPQLMDTGGALRQAAHLFSGHDDVLVHNVDVLSHLDLCAMSAHHRQMGNLVTLAATQRMSSRRLLFDASNRLVGREGDPTATTCRPLAFSGISIVSPDLFALLPEATTPYPIIPCYLQLSAHHPIRCFEHSAEGWLDVGKPATLHQAQQWKPSSTK